MSSLLVLSIILLSPSAGIMTLPVPDNEPDPSAVAICADYSHAGKQWQHEILRIHVGAVRSTYGGECFLPTAPILTSATNKNASASVPFIYQSRAPPLPSMFSMSRLA